MNRFILGPSQSAFEEIRQAAQRHQGGRVRIAVAWARDEGVSWLFDAINRRITVFDFLIGINERGTTVEALLRILKHAGKLRVFYKHPAQTFHPKLYWFDDGMPEPHSATIIVGSSNLTLGGLVSNFEASLVLSMESGEISEADRQFLASLDTAWNQLVTSPYAHEVANDNDVRRLYDAGYLVFEHAIRRERRRTPRREKPLRDLPTAPPARMARRLFERITIPFPIHREELGDAGEVQADPTGSAPLPERFFVRTLTANDVAKLRGRPGTFEPDLGETARNLFPAFWGWPEMYSEVTRQLSRREWQVQARLISSQTPPEGIKITLLLWYREARPGHPAEHRFSPRPISDIRQAVPPAFDTSSLLVVEQAPVNVDYQYVVRLITSQDPEYNDFSTYLTERRPQHRFGYGP